MSTTVERVLMPWQGASIFNPYTHFAMLGGVAVGKTYTGAHFAIFHIENFPHLTGFVGANTYDQLSQTTLMELFYWLDQYSLEYVIDKRPPKEWGPCKKLKKYSNVLSVRSAGRVVTIFTRVLGKGDPLRGLEFSWYWIDETRDTPKNTHDVLLSRLRESDYMKGLITSTTNGEDWTHERFVSVKRKKAFGCMHVPTERSLKAGLITKDFYENLLDTYDEQLADQELHAKHVNTAGKPAYKSYGKHNERRTSPFSLDGGIVSPWLSVIVGMDFNVNPMSWALGQNRGHEFYWFSEIVIENTNTHECAPELVARLLKLKEQGLLKGTPQVKLCGDATGKSRNTKATESDYAIICNALTEAGITWENLTPDSNPPVKDRVNTVNAHWKAANGNIRMWLHPDNCPKLKRDCEQVVWKKGAEAILDQTTDTTLTHISDAIGYPVHVLSPIEAMGSVGITRVLKRG